MNRQQVRSLFDLRTPPLRQVPIFAFYEVRRAFQVGGVGALVEQRRGPKNPHPNRVAPEIEEAVV